MEPKIKDRPVSKVNEKNKEPDEFKVILLNDHFTPMDFVVEILMQIFHKDTDDAFRIMLNVHNKGKAVVGVYTWDIAVTKTEQVHVQAAENQYPLKCVIEPA